MLFVVYNLDKPFSHGLRAVTRDEHLKYVAAAGPAVRIAGPLLSDDGEKMAGSLLVLEMESLEAARAWADNRVTRIYGGTTEIMKEIVGRSMGV